MALARRFLLEREREVMEVRCCITNGSLLSYDCIYFLELRKPLVSRVRRRCFITKAGGRKEGKSEGWKGKSEGRNRESRLEGKRGSMNGYPGSYLLTSLSSRQEYRGNQ